MQDAPPLLLVGVTGGVAAYKTCEVVRRLVAAGRDVGCALTPDAERFVGPQLLAALTRRPVLDDRPVLDGSYPHLDAARDAAVVCIAPLHGQHAREARLGPRRQRRHAERALDAGAAARRAGHERAHVGAPRDAGQRGSACASAASSSSGPRRGALAEGEWGVGRMAEPLEIVAAIEALLARGSRRARRPARARHRRRHTRAARRRALPGQPLLGADGRRAGRRGRARAAPRS